MQERLTGSGSGSGAVAAAAGAFLLCLAAPAAAVGYGATGAPAPGRDGWATALALRPLTLPRELVELAAPVGVDLSAGADRSVTAPLAVRVGAADWLTVGLAHARGLCVGGADGACAGPSEDLRVGALAQVYARGPIAAAYGVSVGAASLGAGVALSAEVLLELRLARGPVALVLAPAYGFGLTRRDVTRSAPEDFPLGGTLTFGTTRALRNRETVRVPVTALAQIGAHLAVAAAIAASGVVDPPQGRFADGRHVPVGFAAVVSPLALLDVGASLTFPNLWGAREGARPRSAERVLSLILALRPGARSRPAAPAVAPRVLPAAVAAPTGVPASAAGAGAGPAAAAPSPAPDTPPGPTLVIEGLAFVPASLEVRPGAEVTIRNRDAFLHSVTSEAAPGAFTPGAAGNVAFDTGVFGAGERRITIPADALPGTVVPFYCAVHRGDMRTPDGELRIVAGAAPHAGTDAERGAAGPTPP